MLKCFVIDNRLNQSIISRDVKTGFFSLTGRQSAETSFLPVIKRLLSTDYRGT